MAWRTEKIDEDHTDLVWSGVETGIAPSPLKGVANLQNVNISTRLGEVMCSYVRTQQSQVGTASNGTFIPNDATTLSLQAGWAGVALKAGIWVNVSASTISGLSTGNYYITSVTGTGGNIQFASYYNGAPVTGFGATGTATFSLFRTMGRAVASATENYFTSTQQYRYYILDSQGLVWVYDTGTVDATHGLTWFLPDTSITYFTGTVPSGIGILNGWLLAFAGNTIWTKSTVNLGGTTSTSSTWVQMTNALMMYKSTTTNPHFILSGHQGKLYYTDGDFIGSIFPNTSLLTGVANIQSFGKYTAVTDIGTITNLIVGSIPSTGINIGNTGFSRIPAVFFSDQAGTRPTSLNANVVYYIQYSTGNENFTVFPTLTGTDTATANGTFSGGETTATLTGNWTGQTGGYVVTFSNGNVRTVTFTNGMTGVTWSGVLVGSATATLTINGLDIATGASGNQYYNTFYPIGTHAAAYGDSSTTTFSPQRLNLPEYEIAQCMTEVGNNVIIGGIGNALYPWNQVDALPSSIIFLPENNTATMITVNQMAYVFAGNKGNVYITDGSVASLVIKVPDYCAGVPGSQQTYIEPYFTWGGAMYVRGRVYFSILDQTATKAGNCGGIWSFVPTQNLYIGQDTGLALRLENQNSYGTYSGVATILLPSNAQNANGPQFWSAWYSDVSSPTYGIDFSGTTFGGSAVIELDLLATGTMLNKRSFAQVEYKLSQSKSSSDTIAMNYRLSETEAWTTCGSAITDTTTTLSGYFTVPFQNTQWLQLQIILTPFSTNPMPLAEIRVR